MYKIICFDADNWLVKTGLSPLYFTRKSNNLLKEITKDIYVQYISDDLEITVEYPTGYDFGQEADIFETRTINFKNNFLITTVDDITSKENPSAYLLGYTEQLKNKLTFFSTIIDIHGESNLPNGSLYYFNQRNSVFSEITYRKILYI